MKKFAVRRIGERIFILLDDQKCGYLDKNEKSMFEISFAIHYQSKPGFRLIKVKLPSFPSEEKCEEYLNQNSDEIAKSFSFHFFE